MKTKIRIASEYDAFRMAEIHAKSFGSDEAWSEKYFVDLLQFSTTFGLIAADAGMVLFRQAADEADILSLAVIPILRCRGVASHLLRVGGAMLLDRGTEAVSLEVRESNTRALRLYRSFGFHRVGVRPRYYVDGTDAFIMRADVSGFRSSMCK